MIHEYTLTSFKVLKIVKWRCQIIGMKKKIENLRISYISSLAKFPVTVLIARITCGWVYGQSGKKVGIMRLEGGIFLGLIWGSSQVLGSFWGRDHFSAIPIIQHSGLHTTNSAIWSVPYTCAQPYHCWWVLVRTKPLSVAVTARVRMSKVLAILRSW